MFLIFLFFYVKFTLDVWIPLQLWRYWVAQKVFLFLFFCTILWKSLNELFDQSHNSDLSKTKWWLDGRGSHCLNRTCCVDHYPLLLRYYLHCPILSTFTQWVSIPIWLFCFGLCMPFLTNPKDFESQAHLTGKEGAWSHSPHLGKGVLWQTGNMDHTTNGRTWWKFNLAALVTDLNSTSTADAFNRMFLGFLVKKKILLSIKSPKF